VTLRSLAIGIGLALGWSSEARAFLPRDPVTLSVEVVVNPAEGAPRAGCEATEPIQAHSARKWSFAISDGGDIRCGGGSGPVSGNPILGAEVSTVARLVPQMEDERVVEVEVSVALQERPGLASAEMPMPAPSPLKRRFFFAEGAEVLLPLWVASEIEPQGTGVHEVFVRIDVSTAPEPSGTRYGILTVTAGLQGAELLLDGGVVGTLSADGETTLPHVRAGSHSVQLREASGRGVTKTVRVEAERTVLVDLRPADSERRAYRLAPLGKNVQGYEEYRRDADQALVVRIPAGEFLMGNRETERSPLEHPVWVSDFLIDKTAVTWGQYKRFAAATGIPLPRHEPFWGTLDDHPAVYVGWEEAKAYCEWAGARLPTEAEREKAARGTDRRKYPWGDELPDPSRAVFQRSWGYEATDAVATHPAGASPYGVHDLGGNVWEWCSDWYDDAYYAVSPYRDPRGPTSGRAHVVRGGSWDSRPSVLSCSCRNWGHRGYRDGDFGFRCAMNAPR
jgi:formylglycine-generating enzyme required for sulfatase activity